jgi:type I restriction enzyme, S subunit
MRWKKVRLGDICTKVVTGKTPPTSVTEYFDGSIKWITPSDFDEKKELSTSNRSITQKAIDENKAPLFPPNSILINCIGNIGKVGILRTKGSSNQQITAIKLAREFDVDFFYYQLLLKKDQLINLGNNSVVPILNSTSLKRLEVSFPDLPTQQHIAAILDKADALRQQNQQLLTYYDELLQGTFIELFGENNSEFVNWKTYKIEELAEPKKGSMRTGPFGSDLLHSEFVDEGILVLGIDNVVNNRFEWAKLRYITPEKYQKLKRYTIQGGDLLISIMGTVGRVAVVPNDVPLAINSKHLAAITLNKRLIDPTFTAFNLHSNPKVIDQITARGRGAIMTGLNLGLIKGIEIKVPPIELQNQFAEIVQRIEAQKAQAQAALTECEALFEGLLAGYFGENQSEMKGSNPGPPTSQLRLF